MSGRHGTGPAADRIIASWRDGRLAFDLVLAPLEAVYRAASGLYHGAYTAGRMRIERAGVPVVSVGNLVIGGAGKTPVAAWVAKRLLLLGARPAVLHGGYGEDEPELHRRWHADVPVHVGRDRSATAATAVAEGATVLVLDDGFQHRRLARDLDLVLVPAEDWTPSPRLLPRGPWREPPSALARADAIAVTRKTADADRARTVAGQVEAFAPDADVFRLALRPDGWRRPGAGRASSPPPGRAIAVAGIARPEAFVANARQAGATVDELLRFPDHHAYTARDAERIRRRAGGRPVVTTEKDALKLERLRTELDLWVLGQAVAVEAGRDALEGRLEALVG